MKNLHSSKCIFAGSIFAASAGLGLAQDWPQWMGPNRDGNVAGFTPPKAWPKTLSEKWKVSVGDGVASPALVGDKLYVFSRQDGGEIIRCLNAADGKGIWQEKYDALGADGPASSFSGPCCTLTVDGGKVIAMGVRGTLTCLDAATGKIAWQKNDSQGALPRFYTSASPVIVDGLCIAQVGGRDNGGIVARDLATGDEKWRWTGDTPGYASPVLMTVGDKKLVIAETEGKLIAVSLADGKLAWETPFRVEGRGYNASTPVIDGQTIYYSGSSRGTTAVRLEKQGDAIQAKELWKNADVSVQFNSPILKDAHLYGLTGRNELFCLNAADGKSAWTAPFSPGAGAPPADRPGGERPGGPGGNGQGRGFGGGRGMRGGGGGSGYGSLVDAGSVLLALTPASELVVFQASDKAFSEIARIKVADSPTHAYPVVSGNRIFIKDRDSVKLLTVE